MTRNRASAKAVGARFERSIADHLRVVTELRALDQGATA